MRSLIIAFACTVCLGASALAQDSSGGSVTSPSGSTSAPGSNAPATGGATVLPPRTGQAVTGPNAGQGQTTNPNVTGQNPNALTPPVPPPGSEATTGGRATTRSGAAGQSGASSGPTAGAVSAEADERQRRLMRRSEQINRTVMRSICIGC
jgi:hypothetical protein